MISSLAYAVPLYKPLPVMESPSPEKVHRWSVSTHRCSASAAGGKYKQGHSGALHLQDRDSDRKLSLRQLESLRAWAGEGVEKNCNLHALCGNIRWCIRRECLEVLWKVKQKYHTPQHFS